MASPTSTVKSTNVLATGSSSSGPTELVLKNQLTALVVDDCPMSRMLHRSYLTHYGVMTYEASDGLEAVKLCQSGMNFNLILMDNVMPTMDGPTATKAIRDLGVASMIVGITSLTEEPEKTAFVEAGLDEFFAKPLNREKLAPVLREIDVMITNNN